MDGGKAVLHVALDLGELFITCNWWLQLLGFHHASGRKG